MRSEKDGAPTRDGYRRYLRESWSATLAMSSRYRRAMIDRRLLVVLVLVACGPGSDDPGEPGPKGDPGVQGPFGPPGAQGSAGPTGTTGQKIVEVVGTGQLQVGPATTAYTIVPGLATTVDVPANAVVNVMTSGGIQCTQAGAAYSVVDIGIFVDGAVSTQGGQRRIVAANTTTVGQIVANWSLQRTYSLAAGSHLFEVKAIGGDPGAALANVSSASAPQLQGVMTITVVRQ